MPSWALSGSADAARQILTTVAAAIITVVGVEFSIVIVALTLTSTQFGPRMLRNFIRDPGTQVTLGTFVGTFVYSVLALGSIGQESRGDFVPHISITVTLALLVIDLGVLIYFIHHIATQIQLPHVIASIARDLSKAIETQAGNAAVTKAAASAAATVEVLGGAGGRVAAPRSGYQQFIDRRTLVRIASGADVVIQMLHRPGHFLVQGYPYATVWPADEADVVARELASQPISPTCARRIRASSRARLPARCQVIGALVRSRTLFGDMSKTTESAFPYHPGGFIPGAEPSPPRSAALIAACGVLLGSAIAGLLGGLIWNAVAPRAAYIVIGRGSADVVNAETTAFIAADAWYCLIAVVGGLILGIASYRFAVRRFGPIPMAALLAGSVLAGWAARWVGQNLGLSAFNARLMASRQGTILHAPPVLGSDPSMIVWGAIAFWPLAACLIPAALVFFGSLRDRQPGSRAQLP